MAALVKKGNVWYAVFYQGMGDERKQKWQALSPSKSIAQVKLADIVKDLTARKYGHEEQRISWLTFCDKYLAYSKTNKKPDTFEKDTRTIRILNRMFPLSSPDDLTAKLLEEYKMRRKDEGKKESTINREIGIFKAMSSRAMEWGYIKQNNLTYVRKLKMVRNRPRFFNQDEVKTILENTNDEFELVMVILGLYTGMRREEVARLKWEDIDWTNRIVRIIGRDGWAPKDYEAREIPLHPTLKEHLLSWKKVNGNAPYIFSLHDRKPDGVYLLKLFKRILKNAGIKGNFHTLRHTFASYLANAGVDLYTLSKLLGHASVKTTEIYAHLQQSTLQTAVLKLKFDESETQYAA